MNKKNIQEPLFVFEMANNHMGNVSHGIELIRSYGKIIKNYPEFNFAIKLQYRNLDKFIHKNYKDRNDLKYIKRFSETKLSETNFNSFVEEIKKNNFITMATPFDEDSVDLIEQQNLDIIKIASCSFNDWPLLERVVRTKLPIIASTAGASIDDIDRVVSFFKNRSVEFVILHCVGQYPTPNENLHLSQINFLRNRYSDVKIGFSTHENPEEYDIVKIAIAKGARVFEKHVGLPTDDYSLNDYSANPQQVEKWLDSAKKALIICGNGNRRNLSNKEELKSIKSLRRGVFLKHDILPGVTLNSDHVYFAFPSEDDQLTANDWSKYSTFITKSKIKADAPLFLKNLKVIDTRALIWEIIQKTKNLLIKGNITVPGNADLEISHHYGLENFYKFGLVLINVINRDYCKKLLISLPSQIHPEQFHKKKEETFHILFGDVKITLDGKEKLYHPGDVIVIEPGIKHSFVSSTGSVIEEISTTHFQSDSFYSDDKINNNDNRKTLLNFWMN